MRTAVVGAAWLASLALVAWPAFRAGRVAGRAEAALEAAAWAGKVLERLEPIRDLVERIDRRLPHLPPRGE